MSGLEIVLVGVLMAGAYLFAELWEKYRVLRERNERLEEKLRAYKDEEFERISGWRAKESRRAV